MWPQDPDQDPVVVTQYRSWSRWSNETRSEWIWIHNTDFLNFTFDIVAVILLLFLDVYVKPRLLVGALTSIYGFFTCYSIILVMGFHTFSIDISRPRIEEKRGKKKDFIEKVSSSKERCKKSTFSGHVLKGERGQPQSVNWKAKKYICFFCLMDAKYSEIMEKMFLFILRFIIFCIH